MRIVLQIFLLTIIFLTSFYTGCIPSKPTEDIEILPSDRLINKLEANRRKIRNFEGNGTIFVKTPTLENSANFRVVMQKPDSIYLTILGPFGIELAQAVVTSSNFVFYDAIENTAYTGEIDSDVLQNIFRINLTFGDLMDAFVGSVNLTPNLYKNPDKFEVIYDNYILTYMDSTRDLTSIYHVDVRELGITEYYMKSFDGLLDVEGKYSKFQLLENVAVPYVISVYNKNENQKIDIEYRKITANKNNIYIDFKLPEDATIIKW